MYTTDTREHTKANTYRSRTQTGQSVHQHLHSPGCCTNHSSQMMQTTNPPDSTRSSNHTPSHCSHSHHSWCQRMTPPDRCTRPYMPNNPTTTTPLHSPDTSRPDMRSAHQTHSSTRAHTASGHCVCWMSSHHCCSSHSTQSSGYRIPPDSTPPHCHTRWPSYCCCRQGSSTQLSTVSCSSTMSGQPMCQPRQPHTPHCMMNLPAQSLLRIDQLGTVAGHHHCSSTLINHTQLTATVTHHTTAVRLRPPSANHLTCTANPNNTAYGPTHVRTHPQQLHIHT